MDLLKCFPKSKIDVREFEQVSMSVSGEQGVRPKARLKTQSSICQTLCHLPTLVVLF